VDVLAPADRRRGGEIYKISLGDGALTRLTNASGWDGSPSWTLDGTALWFYSERSPTGSRSLARIWTMAPDGTAQRPVSPIGATALWPAPWGLDRLAFSYRTDDQWKVVSMSLAGGTLREETGGETPVWAPVAHPDGGFIGHSPSPPAPGEVRATAYPKPFSLGDGPLVASGAPFPATLPGRSLALYPIRAFSVAVSPTGDRIVRAVPPGPRLETSSLLGEDRREVLQLEPPQLHSMNLAWTGDGEHIAYMKGEMFGDPKDEADIWIVDPAGASPRNLTPNSPGNDGWPSFSTDGRQMAFRSGRTGNFEIFLASATGGVPLNVTQDPAHDIFPALSPGGNRLVFASDRADPGSRLYDLYLQELEPAGRDGSLRRLTTDKGQEAHPIFSPDGEWIIYTSEEAGLNDEEPVVQSVLFAPQMYGELFALRLEDGTKVRLTDNKWEDGVAFWIQGGKR